MQINFNKMSGLVPAIVQDAVTNKVLMQGYMNKEAYDQTIKSRKVTFFSRSKERLWTKGEESGNVLHLVSIKADCDFDSLLIKANPIGPVCHKGTDTCWEENNRATYGFLTELSAIIEDRKINADEAESYVASLFKKGINKIAQKVGEEAVEMVIEAKDSNDTLFLEESADLLFHYMILLSAKGFELNDIVKVLEKRHQR
ncbi:bifunctional phosphoribosyl-AMP cyclohydrolase/phosphoribosyl-ATP diphosphatase HisIE [Flavobacteriaceae bacterium F08102]|nr:bifunctional phosphoribosyl-AMP cyclohydrolase/phosphoribosyl-ATP diphosphatase HisIE [Flavobacteriaceae bacterium F08102]